MSDKRIEVLRRLAHNGSISQAARDCGISYKAAWQALDTLTNLAAVALVERSVGGAGGGGALLTQAGHALLQAADAMEQARSEVLARLHSAGLSQPLMARLAVRTSMRNQWPCTVQALDGEGARVNVTLHTTGAQPAPLQAQVTRESAELMGLVPGQHVLAMAKATALQVLGLDVPTDVADDTVWAGEVTRIDVGDITETNHVEGGGEIAVRLPGGLHVVGFAAQTIGMQPGSQVQVQVPAAAVVLALVEGP